MQRERVLLTRYLGSFGTLLGASHARNNVPQRLQLFAPELSLSLLLIGSLLDNRDGPGGGIGRRRFCRRRLGIFALGNHLGAGCAVQVAICPIRKPSKRDGACRRDDNPESELTLVIEFEERSSHKTAHKRGKDGNPRIEPA